MNKALGYYDVSSALYGKKWYNKNIGILQCSIFLLKYSLTIGIQGIEKV
ncbi:hypothetical protein [Clostridioides difficile]|nr:hypothetical protein [Clostridioides difficile]